MKPIFFVLLFVLNLTASAAADFSLLDQQQRDLLSSYQKTLQLVGDGTELRRLIQDEKRIEIKKALGAIEIFFKKYDEFNLKKIDALFEDALFTTRERYLGSVHLLSKRQIKKLNKQLIKIESHYKAYQNKKTFLGKESDYLRVVDGRNFLNGIGHFANSLRKSLKGKPNRIWGTPFLPFIDSGKEFMPLADEFFNLLFSAYFRTQNNKPNRAPIIESLQKISLELSKAKKTQTQWFGEEHLLPMPLDGETLNIFAFMHAHSYFDTAVQATLPLEGLSSIGNVDVIFPKFLATRMKKSDHIITVGHGDTMGKALNIVRSKKLNKFFIAPEGLTPLGYYEMRPLVDDFALALFDAIERGLKLNVYPVSFPENFRFMNDYRRPLEGPKTAYGVIHPALTEKDLLTLLKLTHNKQAPAHLIRWIWFGDLINDLHHDLGMPLPGVMRGWFDGMVWENL